ncbi:hypothetical protein GJ496_007607 [Pomphorhynchus laevis]|nr:hypothetical protein GJ496_007607 [Pomphorhynchus laevis]
MSAYLNLERDSSRSCTSHPIQNQSARSAVCKGFFRLHSSGWLRNHRPVLRYCWGSGHTPLISQKHHNYTERKLTRKDSASSQLPSSSFNNRNFRATPDQHSCVLTDITVHAQRLSCQRAGILKRVWSSSVCAVKRIPWCLSPRSGYLMSSLLQDALCMQSV